MAQAQSDAHYDWADFSDFSDTQPDDDIYFRTFQVFEIFRTPHQFIEVLSSFGYLYHHTDKGPTFMCSPKYQAPLQDYVTSLENSSDKAYADKLQTA